MTYEDQRQSFLNGGELAGSTRRNSSEDTAREIDCAIRELTEQAREHALHNLRKHQKKLDEGAGLLLEKRDLACARTTAA